MLRREVPFLRIVPLLALGIICGRFTGFTNSVIIVLASFAVVALITSLFFNESPENYLFWIFISLSLFISGALLFRYEHDKITPLLPDDNLLIAEIIDFPEEKLNTWLIPAKIIFTIRGEDTTGINNGIILYFRKDDLPGMLMPGDLTIVECDPLPIMNSGNPDGFDYKFYMESRGICYYSFTNSFSIKGIITPERRSLKHRALITREKLIKMYIERGIEGDRLALVAALILGEKSRLDKEQKDIYIRAGVMHIMAVSGLHTGILSLFIFNLLFFMKRKLSFLRVLITIGFLWYFAFVTGLTPSVLRATIMFSFLHAGNLLRRPVNSLNSLLASAFILLIDNPYVLFDAGFLLSYSAVIFIVLYYRSLSEIFTFRHTFPRLIWKSAAVTIVAQAGTFAFSVMFFNRFPTWFLLSNLIIVPLSSAAIITGCLVPLFFPLEDFSLMLARLLSLLTDLTGRLTEVAASLPFSSIENIGMTPFESLLLTLVIGLMIRSLLWVDSGGIKYALAVYLVYCSTITIKTIEIKRSCEIIAFNTPGFSNVAFRSGNVLELYSDEPEIPDEVIKFCATRNIGIGRINGFSGSNINDFDGKLVLLTDSLHAGLASAGSIDLVFIKGRWPYLENRSFELLPPGCMFVLCDAGERIINRISQSGINADRFWLVKRDGAIRITP